VGILTVCIVTAVAVRHPNFYCRWQQQQSFNGFFSRAAHKVGQYQKDKPLQIEELAVAVDRTICK